MSGSVFTPNHIPLCSEMISKGNGSPKRKNWFMKLFSIDADHPGCRNKQDVWEASREDKMKRRGLSSIFGGHTKNRIHDEASSIAMMKAAPGQSKEPFVSLSDSSVPTRSIEFHPELAAYSTTYSSNNDTATKERKKITHEVPIFEKRQAIMSQEKKTKEKKPGWWQRMFQRTKHKPFKCSHAPIDDFSPWEFDKQVQHESFIENEEPCDVPPFMSRYIPFHPPQIGDYIVGETVGMGSFSKVKAGVHLNTGKLVALKMIPIESLKNSLLLQRSLFLEIKILQYLTWLGLTQPALKNVVKLEQVLMTKFHLTLVMEFIPGKELFNYVSENRRLGEKEAFCIFRELLNTVRTLHELGVIHRDLKLENVIVTKGPHGKLGVKLVDFGLATLLLPKPVDTYNGRDPPIQKSEELLIKTHWSSDWKEFQKQIKAADPDDSRLYKLLTRKEKLSGLKHPQRTALDLDLNGFDRGESIAKELCISRDPGTMLPMYEGLLMSGGDKLKVPLLNTRCGSEEYAPPELLRGLSYSGYSSDIWSLGVLLYALVNGCLPFQSESINSSHAPKLTLVASICRGIVRWPNPPPSKELQQLVHGMLKLVPAERWSCQMIQSSDWWKLFKE